MSSINATDGMVDLSVLDQETAINAENLARDFADSVNHLDLKFAAQLAGSVSSSSSSTDKDILALLCSFSNTPGIPKEEKKLWDLSLGLFTDCENSRRYDPAVIGIAHVPNDRRWFVSQFAHIQDILLRFTKFRRMALILRWLEQTADTNTSAPDASHPLELTYQLIFGCLRRGDVRNALKHAEVTRSRAVACSIEGAQLNAAKEVWQTRTATVPLFGEFSNAELEQGWANNDHRLNLLGSLYEESILEVPTAKTELVLEKAIFGALCGNFDATVRPFGSSRRWQDELWAKLRSILIPVFSKALLNFGHTVNSAAYVSSVNAVIGTESSDWLTQAEQSFSEEIVSFIRHVSHTAEGLSESEKLQLRFLSTILVNNASSSDIMSAQVNEDDSRAHFHMMLLCDQAALKQFLRYNPQSSPYFIEITSKHLKDIVGCADGTAPDQKCELAIRVASYLRDVGKRAKAYSVVVRQARKEAAMRRSTAGEIEAFDQHLLQRMRSVEQETYNSTDAAEKVLQVLAVAEPGDDDIILNANKAAEGVFWKSMTTEDNVEPVFLDALDRCLHFWKTNELQAITDVTSILGRRVVERLPNKQENPLFSRYTFWEAFSEVQRTAKAHTKCVHDIKLGDNTQSTIAAELLDDEGTLREVMFDSCIALLDFCDSSLPKDKVDYAAAAAYGVQTFADCATLFMGSCNLPEDLFSGVIDLVMSLENSGVLDSTLESKAAETLFDSVRMARAAANDREHELMLVGISA